MKNENLKEQIIINAEEIVKIILKGNTAEVKKNKEGISVFENKKKKIKKGLD